jgi:multiple sugar transport system permease protein
MKRTGKQIINKTIWYIVLSIASIIIIFPFIWMISTALKTAEQTVVYPPKLIPSPITFRAFSEGLQSGPFLQYFKNSFFVTALCIVGSIFSSVFVGFGFARFNSRLKNILFAILLGTMMIPPTVTLIPIYSLYAKFGWINTFIPLILPSFLGGSAFFTFLARQFFMTIPAELEEAAQLDGCSMMGILIKIFIPISKPVILIITIFTFVNVWNDFFTPMIFLNNPEKYTLAIGLNFFKSQYGSAFDTGPLMAMSVLSIMPILVLFVFAQKYFIQGIATTGLK